MSWHSILGIVSAFALFVPIIVILALRLFTRRSFIALAVYYLISGVYNLMVQQVIKTPAKIILPVGIINNLLDAPLMLLFLVFFSTTPLMTKRIHLAILAFLGFELILLSIFGFDKKIVSIVLGPGVALIMVMSFVFFLRNVRLAITHYKGLGKAVMISSVLLAYTIFSIIYVYYYVLEFLKYDAELVYYVVTFLSALLMTAGILIENKRIKKLAELKHTRKELATIYGQTKTAVIDKDSRFLKTR